MRNRNLRISLIIIIVVVILDQALKIWVKTNMALHEDSFLHWGVNIPWARLHFIENHGMAFGITFPGKWGKIILSLFRIILVSLLTFFLFKASKTDQYTLGFNIFLALIIGGALGNLIDSAFYGMIFTESPYFSPGAGHAHFVKPGNGYSGFLRGDVVDMLYFPLCNCIIPDWVPVIGGKNFIFFSPIFNIADSAVFIGVMGFIFFKNKLEKKEQLHTKTNTQQQTVTEINNNNNKNTLNSYGNIG